MCQAYRLIFMMPEPAEKPSLHTYLCCACRHHVYKELWPLEVGEELFCQCARKPRAIRTACVVHVVALKTNVDVIFGN